MTIDGDSRPDQEADQGPAHRAEPSDEPDPDNGQAESEAVGEDPSGLEDGNCTERLSALSPEGIAYFEELVIEINEMLQFAQKRGIEIPDSLNGDVVKLFSLPQ